MIFLCEDDKNNKLLDALAAGATKLYSLPKKSYIEFSFVSGEEIKELNRETRGVDAVTDVLSYPNLDGILGKKLVLRDYPFDINPENGMLNLGCIVVCLDKVLSQAKEYGTGEVREFSYLVAHGILHVLGYDHIEDADRVIMRKAEEELLQKVDLQKCGITEIEK